jgi:hypothetical protein
MPTVVGRATPFARTASSLLFTWTWSKAPDANGLAELGAQLVAQLQRQRPTRLSSPSTPPVAPSRPATWARLARDAPQPGPDWHVHRPVYSSYAGLHARRRLQDDTNGRKPRHGRQHRQLRRPLCSVANTCPAGKSAVPGVASALLTMATLGMTPVVASGVRMFWSPAK